MTTSRTFPALLQAFFTDRLLAQRRASEHTVASYRDTFRLLLQFAKKKLRKDPSALAIEDFDADLISEFLEHVEKERHNCARTRNNRIAAIHSFFRYVSFCEPACLDLCSRILAIPNKRYERRAIDFLAHEEIDPLLAAPDTSTWIGRRDRTLLLLIIQTGLRVSELTNLCCENVVLGTGAHVRCTGKGRKQRCTPLRSETSAVLGSWLRERKGAPEDPLFPSIRGGPLSRDAVERITAKYSRAASERCPSLKHKNVTPHSLRHTAAMELLQSGVPRSVIALWLGHEKVETTEMYTHADMGLKERALSQTSPFGIKPGRYRPDDQLLAFLERL